MVPPGSIPKLFSGPIKSGSPNKFYQIYTGPRLQHRVSCLEFVSQWAKPCSRLPDYYRDAPAVKDGLLFSIRSKVPVYPKLKDFKPGSGIRQYETREIYLPANEIFYSAWYSLREQRNRFGYNWIFLLTPQTPRSNQTGIIIFPTTFRLCGRGSGLPFPLIFIN